MIMDKKIIAINALVISLFIGALIVPTAMSIEYRYYCLNDATLQKEAVINSNITGSETTYTINQSITCEYSCDSQTKRCQPAPFQQTALVGGLVFVILLITVAVWKLK